MKQLGGLEFSDLQTNDLDQLNWYGSVDHLENVRLMLSRRQLNEVDYLAARIGTTIVGVGAAIYSFTSNRGRLWALNVHPNFQSRGVGSALIAKLEDCIKNKGLKEAELLVDQNNLRGQTLYKKLGYKVIDRTTDYQQQKLPNGTYQTIEVPCFLMIKAL